MNNFQLPPLLLLSKSSADDEIGIEKDDEHFSLDSHYDQSYQNALSKIKKEKGSRKKKSTSCTIANNKTSITCRKSKDNKQNQQLSSRMKGKKNDSSTQDRRITSMNKKINQHQSKLTSFTKVSRLSTDNNSSTSLLQQKQQHQRKHSNNRNSNNDNEFYYKPSNKNCNLIKKGSTNIKDLKKEHAEALDMLKDLENKQNKQSSFHHFGLRELDFISDLTLDNSENRRPRHKQKEQHPFNNNHDHKKVFNSIELQESMKMQEGKENINEIASKN